MALYQFRSVQSFPCAPEELWAFVSSPANLSKITPPSMAFKVRSAPPETMYPGLMISYTVKPLLGIPMNWVTEITQVDEGHFFIDEQRIGPYRLWHHEHRLTPTEDGVLMEDLVSYVPPFGFLGKLANSLFIERELHRIFAFRKKQLTTLFGA